MSAIVTAASTLFTNMFGATGWVANIISLIVSQDFLLVGIGLMLVGASVSYLARLIHS